MLILLFSLFTRFLVLSRFFRVSIFLSNFIIIALWLLLLFLFLVVAVGLVDDHFNVVESLKSEISICCLLL